MRQNEIRIKLAGLGWDTSDRLSTIGFGTTGERGYTAWVSRYDWRGVRLGSSVSFHESVMPLDLTPENIDKLWERLHERAVSAWRNYPESLPYQNCYGEMTEDVSLTNILCNVHGGNPWKGE